MCGVSDVCFEMKVPLLIDQILKFYHKHYKFIPLCVRSKYCQVVPIPVYIMLRHTHRTHTFCLVCKFKDHVLLDVTFSHDGVTAAAVCPGCELSLGFRK